MKSIFDKQKSLANLQRNAFDLSRSNKFTASAGMLLPCFVQECNPNEHFVISPQSFLRTMPLNTAAYVRLKQNIDFYFVPYRLLCRQFPQILVGTKYRTSSIEGLNTYTGELPYFDMVTVAKQLYKLSGLGSSSVAINIPKDICGYNIGYSACRLLDLLGYGLTYRNVIKDYQQFGGSDVVYHMSPFRLLAYQKIYYDYFRNPYYEQNNPFAYNVDSYCVSSNREIKTLWDNNTDSHEGIDLGKFTLRYRNWKKDYFNSLQPYFQGADYLTESVSAPSFIQGYYFNSDGSDNRLSNASPSTLKGLSGTSIPNTMQSGLVGNFTDTNITGFTIANLRSAYALDKLYRLSIAAGDGDYASQIKAHYGFSFPHDETKSTYLGGIDAPVTINEVITTATTNEAVSGKINGKGMSVNNDRTITFDTKEHGIIMGVFSIVPECDYSSLRIDKFNTKLKREDFYQPEFADLGKQPVTSSEYSIGTIKMSSDTRLNNVIGYINRYAEYKTAVDSVHGEFDLGGTLNAWTAPRQENENTFYKGITSPFLKIKPSVLNSVLTVAYDGMESSDAFLVDLFCQVQAVRPMSVSGEPML